MTPAIACSPTRRLDRGQRLLLAAIFVAGLALPVVMASRSQVGWDQLHFLARGWLFADRGEWVQVGMRTSALGDTPGGLTALLVGLPLKVWQDYRAPIALILLSHLFAFLLLDRALCPLLSARERLLFALMYWLNPWRIHFSAFLWDPNYAFFFGAVHTWAVVGQRSRPSFWLSFCHVLAIGAFMQIHSSFAILVIAAVVLLARGYFRPHWAGVVAGTAVVGASLAPWAFQALADPSIIPGGKGFIGRGLIFVFPLLRGVYYWLRYLSFELSDMMTPFDFAGAVGTRLNAVLAPVFWVLEQIIGPLTVLFPLAANLWLWRRERFRLLARPDPERGPRNWLRGFIAWSFIAAVIAFGLSPTTFMAWQALCVLNVAVLPVVLWLGALDHTRSAGRARAAVRAWATLAVVMSLGMVYGAPLYRRGGPNGVTAAVKEDLPMLHELGIDRRCDVRIDPRAGALPDVLQTRLGSARYERAHAPRLR